ncbi:hypothetical protein [Devosia naphthalenivorans]|uniref:hypothetical protein n=1 Tax=Devosia naphthalenivorans TaxID=2082392 RepID=UPI000D3B3612|nr:hypothetical protein [Devosia naphthalenivorans]
MNNPHRINEAYAEYFKSWFLEHASRGTKSYFVTLTFEHEAQRRQRRQAEGLSRGAFEMKAFDHLYNLISRRLIGRNYHRSFNQLRLPRVAAFLDAEGSRHWRCDGELSNIHLHTVWIIEDALTASFEEAMNMNGPMIDAWRSLSFDEIDVREIDSGSEGDVSTVVAYASKLIGFTNNELSLGRDFEIYPR